MDQTSQFSRSAAETRNVSIEEAAVDEVGTEISPAVAALIADVEESASLPETQRAVATRPEVLMKEATMMAACRKTKTEIVAYLRTHGMNGTEAGQVSTKVLTDIADASARFDESKRKAMNRAKMRIGLGALVLIVGFVLMATSAETSGRRSPLGAVIAGAAVVAHGFKELNEVQGQSFERRFREVYR